MRTYEIVAAYNGDLSDTALRTEVKRIKDLISANGGQNVVVEGWGKREFSYSMGSHRYGHYINYMFSTDNHALVAEIQRLFSISDDVLRYQTLRTDIRFKKFKPSGRKVSEFNTDTDDFINVASMN